MIIVKDKIKINSFRDLLKIILKVKSVEFDINLSESHINLILDFYNTGINALTYANHIKTSASVKNYFKSKPTIDNAKTFLKKKKILVKNNQEELTVSSDYLPPLSKEDILLNINVTYLNDK